MEGDSLLVTQALVAHTNSLAPLGYLITDAKFFYLIILMNYTTLMWREKVITLYTALPGMQNILWT